MPERIFIAGATGVIGRRIIPPLLAAGHRITAIGRSAEKRRQLQQLGANAIDADVFDARGLQDVMRGHDTVINMATHIPPSSRALMPGAWRENDRIRSIAAANIADAAWKSGVQRLIQESFAPIYRDAGEAWIDESSSVQPAKYNRSVIDAENAAQRFTASGGTGIILRFAFFYGADSSFSRDMIKYVRSGWAPALGSPRGFMSSISHDDAASAVIAALSIPAGLYNIVDDEPMRRREFFDTLAAALGVAPPRFPPAWLTKLTGSLGETLARSQRMSNAKFKQASGWTPAFRSAREGWPVVVAETKV